MEFKSMNISFKGLTVTWNIWLKFIENRKKEYYT